MRVTRPAFVSLLAAVASWVLCAVAPAAVLAQDAPPPAPPPPAGPALPNLQELGEAIAAPLLRGLGDVLRTALDAWWDTSGPVVLGRLVTLAFGAITNRVWSVAGPLLSSADFFTKIPPQWSYGLPAVQELRARLLPIGAAILALALVMRIAWGAISLVLGRPFGNLLASAPSVLLATGGLLFAPQAMEWWVRFCNAASEAMGATSMPALAQMEAVDRLAAQGVISLVYLAFGLWFLFVRIKLIALAVVLLASAPLAIPAGALPFPQAQRFFHWWSTSFLAVTFVQVLQTLCLAVGGWLLSAGVVAGGAPSDAVKDALTMLVGAGIVFTAGTLPPLLLGGLARAGIGGATVVNSALHLATLVAAFSAAGFPGPATLHQMGRRPVPPAPPPPSSQVGGGYVRSILGSAPKALPPPKP
jgi:hypothetical protein